mmetsp:Transcript_8640/g.15251  ORF Transcript_8640/g.15251 Transcript_8640/m.15251 type:complete len:209 (-) Transcript_8640:15-641(-)
MGHDIPIGLLLLMLLLDGSIVIQWIVGIMGSRRHLLGLGGGLGGALFTITSIRRATPLAATSIGQLALRTAATPFRVVGHAQNVLLLSVNAVTTPPPHDHEGGRRSNLHRRLTGDIIRRNNMRGHPLFPMVERILLLVGDNGATTRRPAEDGVVGCLAQLLRRRRRCRLWLSVCEGCQFGGGFASRACAREGGVGADGWFHRHGGHVW